MSQKVMIIIAARSVTGPAKGVLQLIERMNTDDVDYLLYAFRSDGELPVRFLEGAEKRKISVRLLEQKGWSYFSLVRQAIKEVRNNQVSLVQTHGFKPSVIGFFIQLFCRVKWICFLHGRTAENFKVKFYYFIENIVQLFAAVTIIVSEAQRCKVLKGYDQSRVRILHNAIDIKHPIAISPARQPVRKLLDLPVQCRLLVVVGRLSPEKGVDIFLEAFAKLAEKDKCIHALLVGEGQEKKNLYNQTEALKIENNVHFVGFTETPGDYVADAEMVVVPSRSEGIPNVILEAMAMGKPVVATAVGGIPEIIEDGVSGYLVPPERPDLLSDAIKRVLEDGKIYSRFAVNGKERMKSLFSINKRVSKLISIYQEALHVHR